MASYVLENAKVRVTFADDPTYRLVLQSIENLEDGSAQTFAPGNLFEVVLRDVDVVDFFYSPATPASATGFSITGTGYDPGAFHLGAARESPPLGPRKWFQAVFDYFAPGDSLRLYFVAQLLDARPERVRFSVYVDTRRFSGGLNNLAAMWCAPVILRVPAYASDHYLSGLGIGLVTQNPKSDLVGNGGSYRFNTGMRPLVNPQDQNEPCVGFEPETATTQLTDRMEVFYPEWMSVAISGYGDRGAGATTVYAHDDKHYRGRRFRDWYSGGNVLLQQEGLVENCIAVANGFAIASDADLYEVSTYVRVFKRLGALLGEELGLDYKPWALGSPEGLADLAPKTKERVDDFPRLIASPMFRVYFNQDDEDENGITEEIASEVREAFPGMLHQPLYRANYELMYWNFQNNSPTHPGLVGDTMPDLSDFHCDPEKKTYALELRDKVGDEYDLHTIIFSYIRKPAPYDGLGLFDAANMGAARVQNHLEAANPGAYRSVDDWCKHTLTVTAVATATIGGVLFTKVTLSGPFPDPSLWKLFSTYDLITAGIDHALHKEHLGWVARVDGAYAFAVERQVQNDFKASPAKVYVAGNQTATILVNDVLVFRFQALPGFDRPVLNQIGDNPSTSLCSMADEIGNLGATSGGWATTLLNQFLSECRPHFSGITIFLAHFNMVCFGNHGGETPGSNHQILAWRRILKEWRRRNPQPFQLWEGDGPADWLVGLADGANVARRLDHATVVRGWGESAFFQVVYGDRCRMGGFLGGFEGHITNFLGKDVYRDYFEDPVIGLQYREALAGDFFYGRLPTLGVSPADGHEMGDRPSGGESYTPFFHETHGMAVPGTIAGLFARFVQFGLYYRMANTLGERLRSCRRVGTALVPFNPIGTSSAQQNFHTIGVDESGQQRAPIFHSVIRDHRNDRRLLLLFANDGMAPRTDQYVFDPNDYPELLPRGIASYSVVVATLHHDRVERAAPAAASGQLAISLNLAASEAVVYEVTVPGPSKVRMIRAAIVDRLKGRTDAGDRVYPTRTDAWEETSELPGIGVYTHAERAEISNEAPREYRREVEVVIEAIVEDSRQEPAEDTIGRLVQQVKAALFQDESAANAASRSWYVGNSRALAAGGRRDVLAAEIRFTYRYYTRVDEVPDDAADFSVGHADWKKLSDGETFATDETLLD